MAKVRDYGKLAADIKNIIGESNITGATHCATRLRLILKEDPSDEITKKIEQMPGVIQVVKAGGQYQIVIGMHVKDVYEELSKIMTFSEDAPEVKVGLVDRVIAIIAGSMTPFLYILAGAGLLQGILIITRLFFDIDSTGAGQLYNMISWTPFTFMPVFIAVTASKHFKCNTFIALWCCLALTNPTWNGMNLSPDVGIADAIKAGSSLKFLFIPMTGVEYTSTVIPPIIMVGILSIVEKKLDKVLPDTIKPLLMPVCCTVIMVPLTILAIGPVASFVADALAAGYQAAYNAIPWLTNGVLGFFWQVFVIFGVHHSFTPIAVSELANVGFTIFMPIAGIAVCAQTAACFGVWFKSRNSEIRSVALSASATGLFGITEPAIYGVTLRFKKPFFCGAAAAAVGGIIASFFGTRYFVYPGMVGFLTIPDAIYDAKAQENCLALGTADPSFSRGIIGLLIGTAVACVLAFLLVQIIGFDDPPEIPEEEDEPAGAAPAAEAGLKDTTVYAPMNGIAVPLKDVPDGVFSAGMLGQGVAIDPAEGKLYSPIDGTVTSIFETKHAFTFENEAGAEMLIHMGLDTVELGGKFFTPKVEAGAKVKKGDLIAEFDIDEIKKQYKMFTPILMTNADDYASIDVIKESGEVRVGEPLYTAKA